MNNEILFDKLKPVYPMDTRKKIWFAKPSWINLPRRTFLIYQKKTHVYWLYITQRIIYTSFFGKTVAETSSRKQISLICNKNGYISICLIALEERDAFCWLKKSPVKSHLMRLFHDVLVIGVESKCFTFLSSLYNKYI